MIYQKTLKKACTFEGKGLHTGKYAHMTVMPGAADTGVRFVRTDLPGQPEVDALAENVSNTARSTTISSGTAEVITIEHIMSALTGLGIDNVLIEIDNAEVPILDGSARRYVEAFLDAGLENQDSPRKMIELPFDIEVRDPKSGGWIRIEKAARPSADVSVDFNSRVLGFQTAHWDMETDYAREIGPCRTFVFFHEIEYLFRNNLVKGGDVENAIVIVEKPASREQLDSIAKLFNQPELEVTDGGYLNNLQLHFPDECGRHKLLDLLGDLRLSGCYLNAHISAFKSGHTLNTKAAKAIRAILK